MPIYELHLDNGQKLYLYDPEPCFAREPDVRNLPTYHVSYGYVGFEFLKELGYTLSEEWYPDTWDMSEWKDYVERRNVLFHRLDIIRGDSQRFGERAREAARSLSQALVNGLVSITNMLQENEFEGSALLVYTAAISFDDPRQISWADKPQHYLSNKRRRRTSIAKYLRKLRSRHFLEMEEEDIVALSTAWGTISNGTNAYQFDLVRGEEIIEAYSDIQITPNCMRGKTDELAIYAENPDVVELMIIYRWGEAFGRALVWTCADCGDTIMDRVYPDDSGPHVQAAYDYAEKMGWTHRYSQGHPEEDENEQELEDNSQHTIRLDYPSSGLFPYMDTFNFIEIIGCEDTVYASNSYDGDSDVRRAMTEDGRTLTRLECFQCSFSMWSREDDEDLAYVGDDYYCDACADTYTAICGSCGERMLVSEMQDFQSYGDRMPICDSCAEDIATPCAHCGYLIPLEPAYKHSDGEYYCAGCMPEEEDQDDNEDEDQEGNLGAPEWRWEGRATVSFGPQ